MHPWTARQVSASQCHWEGRGGKLTFRNPPLPLPGRKPCTTPVQQCSDERPQLHLQQSIVSFPCLIHNVGAQGRCPDTSTPAHVHPASPHPCARTHFQSCHLFYTTHASLKGLCTDPAPLVLSQAECTPNANSLPVRGGAFTAGWPVELPRS